MGTTAEKLQKLRESKQAIKAALESKGQKPTDQLSTYAAMIDGLTDDRDATATAADLLKGKTAYAGGKKLTGTIPSKAAATITPGESDQIIAAGQYLAGAQTIKGDANLRPENIRKGVTLMGVTGVMEPGSYETIIEDVNRDFWSKSEAIPKNTAVTYDGDIKTDKSETFVITNNKVISDNANYVSILKRLDSNKFVIAYIEHGDLKITIGRYANKKWEFGPALLLCGTYGSINAYSESNPSNSVMAEIIGENLVVVSQKQTNTGSSTIQYGMCFIIKLDSETDTLTIKNSYTLHSDYTGYSPYFNLLTNYGLCVFQCNDTYYYFFVKSDGTITTIKSSDIFKESIQYLVWDSICYRENYIIRTYHCYSYEAVYGINYVVLDKIPQNDTEREQMIISKKYNCTDLKFNAPVYGSSSYNQMFRIAAILNNANEVYFVYSKTNTSIANTAIELVKVNFDGKAFVKHDPVVVKTFSQPINISYKTALTNPFIQLGIIRSVDDNNSVLYCDTIECTVEEDDSVENKFNLIPYCKVETNIKKSCTKSTFPTAYIGIHYFAFGAPVCDNLYMRMSNESPQGYFFAPMGNIKKIQDQNNEILLGVAKDEITPSKPGKITVLGV